MPPCVAVTVSVGASASCAIAASHLGQSEVQDLGVAAWADEDVGGLDIAVNDACAVRRIQRVGDFDAERQHRVHVQTAMAGDALLQRASPPDTPW